MTRQIGKGRKGRRCILYSKKETNVYICDYKQLHKSIFMLVIRRLDIFILIKIILIIDFIGSMFNFNLSIF